MKIIMKSTTENEKYKQKPVELDLVPEDLSEAILNIIKTKQYKELKEYSEIVFEFTDETSTEEIQSFYEILYDKIDLKNSIQPNINIDFFHKGNPVFAFEIDEDCVPLAKPPSFFEKEPLTPKQVTNALRTYPGLKK